MFSDYLKNTNEKTVTYFESLLKKYFSGQKNIPNSLILWGSDSVAQYVFALDIARNLNCKSDRNDDCNCISCNWIKNNSHPSIKTISKIDYKPEDDSSKVISIKQIQNLLDEISINSEDYRTVIFCDADYDILSPDMVKHIEKFSEYNNVFVKKGEKYWVPKPLSQNVFKEESANALLKTIEETPKNLLFIFMTSSPDDLISTIISRSQMFYVQNTFTPNYNFNFCQEVFQNFPNLDKNNFNDFTQKSLAYMKNYEIDMQNFLELLQAYFTKMLENNYSNDNLRQRILAVINLIIKSKKYDLATVKPQYVLDDLWIQMACL